MVGTLGVLLSLNGAEIISGLALVVGAISLYKNSRVYKDKKLDKRFEEKVGTIEFTVLKEDLSEFKTEVEKDMNKIEEDLKSKVSKDVLDEVKRQFDDQKLFFKQMMDDQRTFISQGLRAQDKRIDGLERRVNNKSA